MTSVTSDNRSDATASKAFSRLCRHPAAIVALLCVETPVFSEAVLERLPDGGTQAQAVVDPRDNVHLLYLKGDPTACDVFYVRRAANESEWLAPMSINSQPNTTISVGTTRGRTSRPVATVASPSRGTARSREPSTALPRRCPALDSTTRAQRLRGSAI